MAIDTNQKRASALAELPWEWGDAIIPSGTIGQAQRQASITVYSGIEAGTPGLEVPPAERQLRRPRRR